MSRSLPVRPDRRAAAFMADGDREPMHDRQLWDTRQARDALIAERLPDWEELRELASRVKEHTLTHLDDYLEQFEANAARRGTHVHWARDADEHNAIVGDLLHRHGTRLLIKSKSMLQQECGMVPFLQRRGITVVESDLGERIQQLSGEPPSHIVAPAIHQRVEDIARLFAREIGTDPDDHDPRSLAEAMRRSARPLFLRADAAMTGANFAVAQTGGFVVCTNEGNADIGAAVAPVHIASIGIEKLIPRLEHLGVFTRLLAPSATGSPFTQFTSHFHGPRRGGELHVVLVDNGRSERLGNEDHWRALKCIKCGACLNTCPVYRRGGGLSYEATYEGPIGVVLQPSADLDRYRALPYYSSLCGSCTEVCPVKIDLRDQIYRWRRTVAEQGGPSAVERTGMRILGEVLARPRASRAVASAGRQALKRLPRWALYRARLNPWGRERELPTVPAQTFRQWYLEHRGGRRDDRP